MKNCPTQQQAISKVLKRWAHNLLSTPYCFVSTANCWHVPYLPRTHALTLTHINNTDRDERTLILEIDNGITVLKSIAITIPLPAPSVSSELFQILSKPGLRCGSASPAGLVLWTVHWRLTRADRLTWAKIRVCTTGTHKQCNLGSLCASNWWLSD